MSLPTINGEFRVATEPEIQFAQSGTAFTRFRAVASKSKKDDSGNWVNDKDFWTSVVCFKNVAENVAESVTKGDLVMISGSVETEEVEKDGQKRLYVTVVADRVGVSLSRKTDSGSSGSGSSGGGSASAAQENPWATQANTGNDAPPF